LYKLQNAEAYNSKRYQCNKKNIGIIREETHQYISLHIVTLCSSYNGNSTKRRFTCSKYEHLQPAFWLASSAVNVTV